MLQDEIQEKYLVLLSLVINRVHTERTSSSAVVYTRQQFKQNLEICI